MYRLCRLTRWTVHLAVGVVLLEAAMPMLACAAAQARGIPVTQLCHNYGVALPGQPAGPGARGRSDAPPEPAEPAEHAEPASEPDGDSHDESESHRDRDDCPLRGLATLAPGELPDLRWAQAAPAETEAPPPAPRAAPRDACACWAAALAHAPPALA